MPRHYALPLLLLLAGLLFVPMTSTHAQDNLLQNPGFEQAGNYVDQRPEGSVYDFAFAPGWRGWFTKQPSTADWMNVDPIAFPQTATTHEGNVAQEIGRGDGTFTAAAYQTVNGIEEGSTLRFRAWVFQESVDGANARTRIGIGSNVGGNPLGDVKWSPWLNAIKSWQQLEVSATVPEGSVTVFLYSTQGAPGDPNKVYYDQSSLVQIGTGDVDIDSNSDADGDGEADVPVVPTTPPQEIAPFVNPQEGDTHTVIAGDTLAAISVAYGIPVQRIRELNDLNSDVLRLGQQLVIREASADAETAPETTPEVAEVTAEPTVADPTQEPTTVAMAQSDADDEVESDDAPTMPDEATDEATEEVTAEMTEMPAEPTTPPTITPIPATPTEAPPAPVEEGVQADPLATESEVCVVMYEDANENRIREGDEGLLTGGTVTLSPTRTGEDLQYQTDGESEPYCFAGLEPGSFTASATAPDGYGLTTSDSVVIDAQPGQRFQLRFGAAEGVEVAVAPTADSDATAQTDNAGATSPGVPDTSGIRSILGIVVIALAGLVLVGGIAVALITRGG